MLSLEFRRKVYFWIIDDQIIHIEFESHFNKREKITFFRLFRYACVCSLWKIENYELYTQLIIIKSNIDWHMRISKEKHSSKLHDECYLLFENLIQHENCFDLLCVSRKTHRETRKLLFATTKWFIDNSYVLKRWFTVIFRDFFFTIRYLHLDMHMKNNFSNNNNIAIAWKIAIFEFIFTKFLDFQTLNLFIHIDKHIKFETRKCFIWRQVQLWISTKSTLFITMMKFFVIIHFVDAKLTFELWCYIRLNREIIMKFENIKFISFEIVILSKDFCDHWIMKSSEQNIANNQNYIISIYVRDILLKLNRLSQMIRNKF